MPEIRKKIRLRNGIKFAFLFTCIYFVVGGIGIWLTDYILSIITSNKEHYRSLSTYKGWIFLIITSSIMFYIALRFIYRDREHIKLLLDNRRKLNIYKTIFEQMNEGLIITSDKEEVLNVNPSFTETTGYSSEEVIGKSPRMLSSNMHSRDFYKNMWRDLSRTGKWQGEIINRRKNGQLYPEQLSITVLKDIDGKTKNYIGIFTDISKQRKAEGKIEFLTHYDSLTRLPKLKLFMKHLNNHIEHKIADQFGLLIIDIAKLQDLNATFGYKLGDELLQTIAIRLQSLFKGMTIARVNSKEFAIILTKVSSHKEVMAATECMLKEIELPLQYEGEEYFVTATIGASFFPDHGITGDVLYRKATLAKTTAKENGIDCQLFGDELQSELTRKVVLEKHLHKAIENNELQIFYQPQIAIKEKKIIGFEALLRWNHFELGMVSPAEFIPLAEETGLIIPIGDWVLEKVCTQLKSWDDEGIPLVNVAVNLSPKQFKNPNLVTTTKEIINKTAINPTFISFEITETISLFHTNSVIETINELKKLQIEVSIDDFGKGHSSLSYLQKLPIDNLKIDRSFIWDIPMNQNNMALTSAIIAMAHQLNLTVIAEGIETKEQLEFLEEQNCEYAQGYYFSRPIPSEKVKELLSSQVLLDQTALGKVDSF